MTACVLPSLANVLYSMKTSQNSFMEANKSKGYDLAWNWNPESARGKDVAIKAISSCKPTGKASAKCLTTYRSISVKNEPPVKREVPQDGWSESSNGGHLPGKRWRQKRDLKYRDSSDTVEIAHLRVALNGLQQALPSQAKCRLIAAMRSYMNSESTPEAFAEAIKTLVDEFHVVVPTGSGRDQRLAMPVKRRLDATAAAPLAKRGRQEPKVEAICYGGTLGMRAKGMSSKAAGVGAEDSSEAWEALVSVCSML